VEINHLKPFISAYHGTNNIKNPSSNTNGLIDPFFSRATVHSEQTSCTGTLRLVKEFFFLLRQSDLERVSLFTSRGLTPREDLGKQPDKPYPILGRKNYRFRVPYKVPMFAVI
jgi:hypothetical protein